MTLAEIEKEYSESKSRYAQMYEEELQRMLTDLGLWDRDVIFKNSFRNKETRGVLRIYPVSYNSIQSEVKFIPYKKDGSLSSMPQNIFVWGYSDPKKFEENIKAIISPFDEKAEEKNEEEKELD